MKKLLLILLLISSHAFAQQDTTTLYASPGYANDPLRVGWVKKVERADSLWILKLYNKKNVLQEQISFSDQKLEVRKGAYAFYQNGGIKIKGDYDKGYKHGEWITYTADRITEKAKYLWDLLHGDYQAYWDNGSLKKEGIYAKGKKVGIWKLFYQDGKPAYHETYKENGALLAGQYFNRDGKSIEVSQLIEPPSYPGGKAAFDKYVNRAIKYPKKALQNKIQGTVKAQFTVKEDGTMNDLKLLESPDPELSREAVRILKESKLWQPAKELGTVVDYQITVAILFSID